MPVANATRRYSYIRAHSAAISSIFLRVGFFVRDKIDFLGNFEAEV